MAQSSQYATKISDLPGLLKMVGTASAAQWVLNRAASKLGLGWPKTWNIHPRQLQHSLLVRLGASSDINVFNELFIKREYASLQSLESISQVLDLGANVGYSSAIFLNFFPGARVVAVEPDERNFEMCCINLKPYGDRVLLLHGAVWSRCGRLSLSRGTFGDGREWATQVVEPAEDRVGDVQAWDVCALIHQAGGGQVDLLKVDIEGAELEVFGKTAQTWLPRVRNICIELHGKDCEEIFFDALAGFDYELETVRELTLCKNIRPKRIT
jgi:FkbM family methyltransferase